MKSKFYSYVISVLFFLSAATAMAQDEESLMTYDLATSAMDAAEAYAREQGWNVTILITDQNNNPVMLRRIDGAVLDIVEVFKIDDVGRVEEIWAL